MSLRIALEVPETTPMDITALPLDQLCAHGWAHLPASVRSVFCSKVAYKPPPQINLDDNLFDQGENINDDNRKDGLADSILAAANIYETRREAEDLTSATLRAVLVKHCVLSQVSNVQALIDSNSDEESSRRSKSLRVELSNKIDFFTTLDPKKDKDRIWQHISDLFVGNNSRNQSYQTIKQPRPPSSPFVSIDNLCKQFDALVTKARSGESANKEQTVLLLATINVSALIPVCEEAGAVFCHIIFLLLESIKDNPPDGFIFRTLVPILHIIPAINRWRCPYSVLGDIQKYLIELSKYSPFRDDVASNIQKATFVEKTKVTSAGEFEWCDEIVLPYAKRITVIFNTVENPSVIAVCHVASSNNSLTMLNVAENTQITDLAPGTIIIRCNNSQDDDNDNDSRIGPTFTASIRADIETNVEMSWQIEVKNALSSALISIGDELLSKTPVNSHPRYLLFPLMRGGINFNENRSSIGLQVLSMDDSAFLRVVKCRRGDITSRRAILAISVHHAFGSSISLLEELWKHPRTRDIINRLCLIDKSFQVNSNPLNLNFCPTKLAKFVCSDVIPLCELQQPSLPSLVRIVEYTSKIVENQIEADVCKTTLKERMEIASLQLQGLNAFKTSLCISDLPQQSRLLVGLRNYMSKCHYLSPIIGCGDDLENKIRTTVHGIIIRLFLIARKARRLQEVQGERLAAHRFLQTELPHGSFTLSVLSLLACQMDAIDVLMLQKPSGDTHLRVTEELTTLIPHFSDFARSNSFNVTTEAEEKQTNEAMSALINLWASHEIGNPKNEIEGSNDHGYASSYPITIENQPLSYVEATITGYVDKNSKITFYLAPLDVLPIKPTSFAVKTYPTLNIFGEYSCADISKKIFSLRRNDVISFVLINNVGGTLVRIMVNNVIVIEHPLPIEISPATLHLIVTPDRTCVNFRFTSPFIYDVSAQHPLSHSYPTPHFISTIAQSTLHLLMQQCVTYATPKLNLLSAAQQTIQTECQTSALTLLSQGEETITGLVEGIGGAIRALTDKDDATHRVKVRTARSIYDRILYTLLCTAKTILKARRHQSKASDLFTTVLHTFVNTNLPQLSHTATVHVLTLGIDSGVAIFKNGLINSIKLENIMEKLVSNNPKASIQFVPSLRRNKLKFAEFNTKIIANSSRELSSFYFARGNISVPLNDSSIDDVSFSVRISASDSRQLGSTRFIVGFVDERMLDKVNHLKSIDSLLNEANSYMLPDVRPEHSNGIIHRIEINLDDAGYLRALMTDSSDLLSLMRATRPRRARLFNTSYQSHELERYIVNTMCTDPQVIYGDDDIITVTSHVKKRQISFERNGFPLGVLYSNIPKVSTDGKEIVLVPLVGMRALGESEMRATFVYFPKFDVIAYRNAILCRKLISFAPEAVTKMIEKEKFNSFILTALGGNGDLCSLRYITNELRLQVSSRMQQRMRLPVEHRGKFLGYNEAKETVLLHSFSLEKDKHNKKSVPYVECCTSRVFIDPSQPADRILNVSHWKILSNSLSKKIINKGNNLITIQSPHTVLKTIRVISDAVDNTMSSDDDLCFFVNDSDILQNLTIEELLPLFNLLCMLSSIALSNSSYLIQLMKIKSNEISKMLTKAWSSAMVLPDEIDLFTYNKNEPIQPNLETETEINQNNTLNELPFVPVTEPVSQISLDEAICSTCGKSCWSISNECSHPLPFTLAEVYHDYLKNVCFLEDPPYVPLSWASNWKGEEISFELVPSGEIDYHQRLPVAGNGQDARGTFNFTGFIKCGCIVEFRITYDYEKLISNDIDIIENDDEWDCPICTFKNAKEALRCAMCNTVQPGATWSCSACSSVNHIRDRHCGICGRNHERPEESEVVNVKKSLCKNCKSIRSYSKFEYFKSKELCSKCDKVTDWIVCDEYHATVKGWITTEGNVMNLTIMVGPNKTVTTVSNTEYSLKKLEELVLAHNPEALSKLLRPIPTPTVSHSGTISTTNLNNSTSWSYAENIAYYASKLLLYISIFMLNKKSLNYKVLANALSGITFVTTGRIRAFVDKLNRSHLVSFLDEVLSVIMSSPTPFLISLSSAIALLVPEKINVTLYVLAAAAAEAKDYALQQICVNEICVILDKYKGLSLQYHRLDKLKCLNLPTKSFQRFLILVSLFHGKVMTERVTSTALCYLLQSTLFMEREEPLPLIFSSDKCKSIQYIFPLPETNMNEDERLLGGQVRSSISIDPSARGKYYYEIVCPPNFNRIFVGWGTRNHELQGTSSHVGTDFHSVAFDLKGMTHLLSQLQEYRFPNQIKGGDVIGALLDLDENKMCWSVNGEGMRWLSFPLSGPDPIYMFVSTDNSEMGGGIEIRFGNTQYLPDGYNDFSSSIISECYKRNEDIKPKNYDFYAQLSSWMNELGNIGIAYETLRKGDKKTELFLRDAILSYPLLSEMISKEDSLSKIFPYMEQLESLSNLAHVASTAFDLSEGFPSINDLCQKSRDLQLFSARWAAIERLLRAVIHRDAEEILEIVLDVEKARILPDGPLKSSITGQLFDNISKEPNFSFKRRNMFAVKMANCIAQDEGGIFRTAITMMSEELMFGFDPITNQRIQPKVPLFVLNTHSTIVKIVPNINILEQDSKDRALEMFTWLGKMFGNAVLSGTMIFCISLPRMIWKQLLKQKVSFQDYVFDIDDCIKGTIEDKEFMLSDDYFTLPNIEDYYNGSIEVLQDEPNTPISPDCGFAFPRRGIEDVDSGHKIKKLENIYQLRRNVAVQSLLGQYENAVSAIRFGLESVLPQQILSELRWDDLERRVTGLNILRGTDLLAEMDLSALPHEVHDMLVELLTNKFSDELCGRFLLFATGQTRLPIPEKIKVSCGDHPDSIPTAHTCAPISLTIQAYSSVNEMMQKFQIAFAHAYDFGFV